MRFKFLSRAYFLKATYLILLPLLLVLLVYPKSVFAQTIEELQKNMLDTISPAQKEVIKITEAGLQPAEVELTVVDGSVFFLNTTEDALLNLEVDFGKNRLHCWTPNMAVNKSGVMYTTKPIGPKDFALMCFPEKDNYHFTVKGLKAYPKGLKGVIKVTHSAVKGES